MTINLGDMITSHFIQEYERNNKETQFMIDTGRVYFDTKEPIFKVDLESNHFHDYVKTHMMVYIRATHNFRQVISAIGTALDDPWFRDPEVNSVLKSIKLGD